MYVSTGPPPGRRGPTPPSEKKYALLANSAELAAPRSLPAARLALERRVGLSFISRERVAPLLFYLDTNTSLCCEILAEIIRNRRQSIAVSKRMRTDTVSVQISVCIRRVNSVPLDGRRPGCRARGRARARALAGAITEWCVWLHVRRARPAVPDGQDERRIEELHKRRNFLAAYCKLIVYNVAPIRRAADVFKHYIKCYNDYGDIIKSTLSKAREINKLSCALTMQLAMQALFSQMVARHPDLPSKHKARPLPDLQELKELAKRFSVMFGLDAVKNREALTALHRAGIVFAALEQPASAPPTNLLFLEPLAEFSNKLLRQDKRQVLKFLDARISYVSHWGELAAPLTTYRNSLLTDAPDDRPPPARKHYARQRRGGAQDEDEAEEGADSDQEQPG